MIATLTQSDLDAARDCYLKHAGVEQKPPFTVFVSERLASWYCINEHGIVWAPDDEGRQVVGDYQLVVLAKLHNFA